MDWKVQYNLEEREKSYVSVCGSCNQMQFFIVVSDSSAIQFTKDKEMQFSIILVQISLRFVHTRIAKYIILYSNKFCQIRSLTIHTLDLMDTYIES